jgi:hypothetical protein
MNYAKNIIFVGAITGLTALVLSLSGCSVPETKTDRASNSGGGNIFGGPVGEDPIITEPWQNSEAYRKY